MALYRDQRVAMGVRGAGVRGAVFPQREFYTLPAAPWRTCDTRRLAPGPPLESFVLHTYVCMSYVKGAWQCIDRRSGREARLPNSCFATAAVPFSPVCPPPASECPGSNYFVMCIGTASTFTARVSPTRVPDAHSFDAGSRMRSFAPSPSPLDSFPHTPPDPNRRDPQITEYNG